MKLDIYQTKAVKAKERNVLVVAAPGSGKTTVIINRINYLVEEKQINEGNIIVLTFTKSAAGNMKNRYINAFKKERSPFFGTFHGLFYKILLREGKKINIIDGFITNKIIEGVLRKYFDEINDDKVKEAVNNISLYKTSRKSMMDFTTEAFSKEIFEECYKSYSKYKDEHDLLDFDDLALNVLKLFEDNFKVKERYKNLFRYILVDEFQDCDQLQVDFLKMINEGKNGSLFAVGDEDQCIYSFRGSKPEYMVIFDKIYKDAKKYYLSKNYRSSKNIIEVAKKVIEFNKQRNKKKIVADKLSDGIINCSSPYDERMEGEEIVQYIKDLEKTGIYSYRDNIVLYRTNMESMSIVDTFIRNKIPFTMLDKEYNFFNHFICKDLLAYLSLAQYPYDREAFVHIINKPFRYVSKSSLAYISDYKYEKNPFDILIDKTDTPPFQKKNLEALKKDFSYIAKASLSSAVQFIIMDLEYIDYLKSYCEKFGTSIEDLEEILDEFKASAAAFKTIQEFFQHVDDVAKKLEESKKGKLEDRVLLSTIHGVKGMEFKNVFLINCNEDTIPHSSSKEGDIEEERRLFYVGITRAIDNLYLFTPRTRKGSVKEPSRFIVEGELKKETKQSHNFEVGVELHHRAFGDGEVLAINDDEVTIKFEDGVKRKFSGKVLLDNNLVITIK